ncbi:hypothetical protein [Halobellus limi]|uniref:DUF8049 domain-containing protein n=1 Tax=Halobellus limi TaxID=699433 RepID=A0A1H5YVF6_9EURY|nr:hypothetical protein [Halobellus limi]SEG27988.1 hypothetical protein SAMN04488133_1737 [Halobellus limi]
MTEEPADTQTEDGTGTAEADLPTDDLRVAVVAAACTVGLTLLLQYGLGREVALAWRLLPLAPYFLSLFTKRLELGGLDTPRNWSLLTVAVTLATFGYVGFVA